MGVLHSTRRPADSAPSPGILLSVRRIMAAGWMVSLWWAASVACAAEPGLPPSGDPAAVLRGSQLARTYCVTCHLFPEPDALDSNTWFQQVLPRMKYRLGF